VVDDTSLLALERDTARYYDAEEGREGRPLDPRRIAARDRFIEVVRADGRNRPVLEIGTGPGRDALALINAGLPLVGVDLSLGHATRASAAGVTMTVASGRALPFATSSIGALWSMSTLMHIPAVAIEATMLEIARVLAPDATVAVGVWGGPDVEHLSERDAATQSTGRRLFSRRSERSWRSLLEIVGRIDVFEVWEAADADDDAFRYHMAFVTAT
jgi:SAM-dependent methyltransferase